MGQAGSFDGDCAGRNNSETDAFAVQKFCIIDSALDRVSDGVTKIGSTGYVYARNLLATRLYRCPVVYCEPYVMNSRDAFARIQAGDYDGTRNINGIERKSVFREYVDSVVNGLVEYYRAARSAN